MPFYMIAGMKSKSLSENHVWSKATQPIHRIYVGYETLEEVQCDKMCIAIFMTHISAFLHLPVFLNKDYFTSAFRLDHTGKQQKAAALWPSTNMCLKMLALFTVVSSGICQVQLCLKVQQGWTACHAACKRSWPEALSRMLYHEWEVFCFDW